MEQIEKNEKINTGEMRQDPLTRKWVILAPGRKTRPNDFAQKQDRHSDLPEYDPNCPFCPGQEDRLAEMIYERKAHDDDSWLCRIVANKYPVVRSENRKPSSQEGEYKKMAAYGLHEVLIESPLHNDTVSTMTSKQRQVLFDLYRYRYMEIIKNYEEIQCVIIFRNHGEGAGTSLLHPHSQLIALAKVPHQIEDKKKNCREYTDRYHRCLVCDMLAYEANQEQRVVYENPDFLVFIPFAAQGPFETWIVPKVHQYDFGLASDTQIIHLADAAGHVLTCMDEQLGQPDFNYVIDTYSRHRQPARHLHWLLRIQPRLMQPAGFEIGSGMAINISWPEKDAAILRGE